ncbi:MAG: hypothetical protein M3O31_06670 [Acidobacteriota bacterium]|nr:hypothetical protein [Acidobacteriota bacterium]
MIEAVSKPTIERRVATPRADLWVIKIGDRYQREAVSSKEKASGVLARVGKVMNKPGTDRKRVFRSISGKRVFAYSIDPKDTSKVVREDITGKQTVGRFVSGKFRAASAV